MVKKIKFEVKISTQLNKLIKKGVSFFIKSPTPIRMIPTKEGYKMTYSEKALCDFIGIYNKKFVIIEAKEVSGKRFDFKRLKDHQIKQLSSIKRFGGYAFIFFELKEIKKVISVKIDDYLIYINQTTKKSININALLEIGETIELESIETYFKTQVN